MPTPVLRRNATMLDTLNGRSAGKNRIWASVHMNWTSLGHLNWSCQESGQGLEEQKKKHWESTTGLRQAKGLTSGPSAKRTKDLLKLNRDQLRWVVGLLTGHCHLKGHLFKLGLTDNPTCERCLEEDESVTHIVCDCEAIGLFKISSPGPVLYGTKWLLWRPQK
jgi:hypothetical protein